MFRLSFTIMFIVISVSNVSAIEWRGLVNTVLDSKSEKADRELDSLYVEIFRVVNGPEAKTQTADELRFNARQAVNKLENFNNSDVSLDYIRLRPEILAIFYEMLELLERIEKFDDKSYLERLVGSDSEDSLLKAMKQNKYRRQNWEANWKLFRARLGKKWGWFSD